jgi:hypothetical protein
MHAMALATAVALFVAGPVLADDPITTAPAAGPAAPQPTSPPPPLTPDRVHPAEDQPMAMGPCGPEKVKADGSLATTPHGEVEAGVGTNGYRHLAGAVCQPIGQNGGAVAIGVSQTQGDWNYRRR